MVFLGLGGCLIWKARNELGWGQRKKDLMRTLSARLARVEVRAAAGDWRGVGTEMTNTVYFVLGAITGEGGANVELAKLLLKAPPSVRRELAAPSGSTNGNIPDFDLCARRRGRQFEGSCGVEESDRRDASAYDESGFSRIVFRTIRRI